MTVQIYNDISDKYGAAQAPEGAIPLSDILKVLETMKDIDWASIVKLLEDKRNDIATLTTLQDLLRIVGLFVPQAALAAGAIGLLIVILNGSSPTSPYTIPGYHWDMLEGWVPDSEGE